jgi:hypothetical protein
MTTFDIPEILDLTHQYIDALHDRSAQYFGKHYPNVEPPAFGFEVGTRFIRIYRESGTSRSVHAFLDRTTGDVLKPGGWNGPQRTKKGLAVRFNLSDPESRALCFSRIDPSGSYLYK